MSTRARCRLSHLSRQFVPFFALLCWLPAIAIADEATRQSEAMADTAEGVSKVLDDAAGNEEQRNFLAMPIPISNPTIGTGLGAIGMYMKRLDEVSPTSSFTVGGIYTNTDSKAAFLGAETFFGDNRYRANFAVAAFDMNLRFYGIGNVAGDAGQSIELNQKGTVIKPEFLWRIRENLYLGPNWVYLTIDTTWPDIDIPGSPAEPPNLDFDEVNSGPGIRLEYDTRENRMNPQSGSYIDVTGVWFEDSFGSDFDYTKLKADFRHYIPFRGKDIIALQGTVCMTGGSPPFYGLCMLGQDKDLRGYVGGQYRDERGATAQVEYRWSLPKRFGAVFFAGIGQVGEKFSDFSFDDLLPSGGAGLRWMASVNHKVNLSVDYAVGKDDSAWYFYIAESF